MSKPIKIQDAEIGSTYNLYKQGEELHHRRSMSIKILERKPDAGIVLCEARVYPTRSISYRNFDYGTLVIPDDL